MDAWGGSWGTAWGSSWGTDVSPASPVSSGGEYRRRRSGLGPAPRRKRELEELVVEKQVLVETVEEVKIDIEFASSDPLKEKLRIELDGLERKLLQIEKEEEDLIFILALL